MSTADQDRDPATSGGGGGRTYLPIVLLAVAALLMWIASRMTWVSVSSSDGLTEPRTDELNGSTWFGALTPLALVLLAAVAALLAVRGWLRRVLGVLIALVAAVTAVPAFALLTGSGATAERAATLAELPGRAEIELVATAPFPAVLTMLAALAGFAAGVLLARMPADTARASGKYDNSALRRSAAAEQVTADREAPAEESADLTERVLWDALDAGTDPTEEVAGSGEAPRRDRGRD